MLVFGINNDYRQGKFLIVYSPCIFPLLTERIFHLGNMLPFNVGTSAHLIRLTPPVIQRELAASVIRLRCDYVHCAVGTFLYFQQQIRVFPPLNSGVCFVLLYL